MTGFLRFAAYFVVLVALFVLVILPLVLSPLLTQMVRDMGLRADTVHVTVAPFDPSLLLGRSRRVTLSATNVDVSPARIGSLDLALGDATYLDRSFQTVSGELRDIALTVGGETIEASVIALDGPAAAAGATARLTTDQTERLVRIAAQRAGIVVDDVRVSASGVTVSVRDLEATAQLMVRGGALILDSGLGATAVLLQPAPSDPWSLNEAWISDAGLNIRGEVDVQALFRALL